MSELMKNLSKLYSLQLIDSEMLDIVRQLRRMEDKESETKKRFDDLATARDRVDQEIKPIQMRAKEIKDENTTYLEKKKNIEDRLFNADTDPRDLQYLQKEREQYINLMKKNEDELVRLMVSVDSAEIKKSEFAEKLAELEPEYNKETKEREEAQKTLNARLEELKKQRQTFRGFEDKSLLARYQSLQKKNDGVAIATITGDGVCDGCFVEVSKATLQRIEEAADIVTCQRCGRILFISAGS